jgi:uncharacterized protein HemX
MTPMIEKRLVAVILWGTLVAGAGPAITWAQNPQPSEPPPGTRADRLEDRQEYRQLEQKIRLDRERLRADTRQFGRNSPQARADRGQLRRDQAAMKRLKADIRRDKQIARRNPRQV